MHQYLEAVRETLTRGTRKENRTGVDTISTFNINYEIDLAAGFPLLTTKKINWKNIVAENLWFISGEKTVASLHRHGGKFWDPWVEPDGTVPSGYGFFWRHFPVPGASAIPDHNDQLRWAIDTLMKNPMSRRIVITAWAPAHAQQSSLPPCHVMWILNVQLERDGEPRLCLHLTQRSCDMALGVPYNIAGYAFQLQLISHLAGIKPGIFAHTLVDAHIYTAKPDGSMAEYDHKPGLYEQLAREPRALPRLTIDPGIETLEHTTEVLHESTDMMLKHFYAVGYEPYPHIPFKVAV